MKIKKTFLLIVLPYVTYAVTGTLSNRLDALEYSIGVPLTGADIENENYKSPEMYVMEEFDMTESELLSDIIALSQRYTITETNNEKRIIRNASLRLMGYYGTTNELEYLSAIWKNNNDYSQRDALKVAMAIAKNKNSDQLWEVVGDVFAVSNNFPQMIKFAAYSSLATFSEKEVTNSFLRVRKERIASFFLERAALEEDSTLYVDRVACDLNPSYRHSQQRRDNLARLRPAGLTGEQAEIYSARQRDALPKEDE